MLPGDLPARPLLFTALFITVVALGFALARLMRFVQQLRLDHQALQRTRDVMSDAAQDLGEVFSTGELVAADRIMEQILYSAQRTTGAGAGAIFLAGDDGILQARAMTGLFPPPVEVEDFHPERARSLTRHNRESVTALALAPGEGLLGEVARHGKALLITHALADARVPRHGHPDLEIRSFLAVPIRFRSEIIGVMAVVNPVHRQPFTREDQDNLQVLADQASLSIFYSNLRESLQGKDRLDQEMQVARRIQDSLQARDVPRVPGVEIVAVTNAAMEVGGDYVDAFRVDADRIGLVVGDVRGKGVGGAIYMAILRTMLRARAVGLPSPAETLKQVNAMVLEDMRHESHATLIYMVLDHRARTLRVTRAGHDPLLLRRAGGDFQPFGSEGPALGFLDPDGYAAVVPEDVLLLRPGDTVLAYTDGIVEALDDTGEEWGEERFLAALARGGESASLRDCLDGAKHAMLRFAGNMPQSDDVTLLGVRVHDAPPA
jgi:serine phosphatase RsbU (regulator of sigma subunit)